MNVKILRMGTHGLYTLLKPNFENCTFDRVQGSDVKASQMTPYGFREKITGHCNEVTAPSVEYKDRSKWKQGAFINFVKAVKDITSKAGVECVLIRITYYGDLGNSWQCRGDYQLFASIESAMI